MIRLKHLDTNTPGMRRNVNVYLGDLTATLERPVFVAPVDCRIDFLDFYSQQGNTFNTSQCNTITARVLGASNNTLGKLNVAISANDRNRITPSSNNSLTAGAVIQISYSSTCQVLSAVIASITYTPLKHRATR